MSKKHFIELADCLRLPGMMPDAINNAIREVVPDLPEGNRVALKQRVLAAVANDLADFCKQQNSQFNRERWLGYIAGENGPNGGKL